MDFFKKNVVFIEKVKHPTKKKWNSMEINQTMEYNSVMGIQWEYNKMGKSKHLIEDGNSTIILIHIYKVLDRNNRPVFTTLQ
jgi:hypothetical protein